MIHFPKTIAATALGAAVAFTPITQAAEYAFDIAGAHAFVQFRVKHLGYSWLYGRFNDFNGTFSFDENNPAASTVEATIDMTSLDSNHAERDKHLRGQNFLNVSNFGTATFKSTSYKVTGETTGELSGDLTFFGATHPITIDVEHIGGGPDPWGGYRQGFEGRAVLKPAEWGLDLEPSLGPASTTVELMLTVEGVRQ